MSTLERKPTWAKLLALFGAVTWAVLLVTLVWAPAVGKELDPITYTAAMSGTLIAAISGYVNMQIQKLREELRQLGVKVKPDID